MPASKVCLPSSPPGGGLRVVGGRDVAHPVWQVWCVWGPRRAPCAGSVQWHGVGHLPLGVVCGMVVVAGGPSCGGGGEESPNWCVAGGTVRPFPQ